MRKSKPTLGALSDIRLKLLLWPTLLVVVALSVLPTLLAAAMAFTGLKLGPTLNFNFVGLDNFQAAFDSSSFMSSFGIGWIWSIGVTSMSVILGLILAIIINFSKGWGATLRLLALFPWALSPVIVAILWRIVFDPYGGPINATAKALNLPFANTNFLGDFDLALPSVMMIGAWLGIPVVTISYLAALRSVPKEMVEAAMIDGANVRKALRFVILPQLGAVTSALVSLNIIWNFNSFGLIYVLTNGGPGGKTNLPALFVYNEAFHFGNFGYAAALGLILTLTLLVVFGVFSAIRSRVEVRK